METFGSLMVEVCRFAVELYVRDDVNEIASVCIVFLLVWTILRDTVRSVLWIIFGH